MGKDKTMKDEKKGFDMEGTQEMPKPEEHGGGAVKGVNVRPKEEAMSLILETLQKAKAKGDELGIDVDTFGGQDAVEPVLDALYAAYEEEGTVPSREGFAERCGDKGLAEFVLDMPRDRRRAPSADGRDAALAHRLLREGVARDTLCLNYVKISIEKKSRLIFCIMKMHHWKPKE